MKLLGEKMKRVMEKISFITFDGNNKSQNYKYASAAGILHQVHKALEEEGLMVDTQSEVLNYTVSPGKEDGKYVKSAVVKETVTIFEPESSESISWQGVGEGQDWGDKAVMKASTAAYKYAIAHGLVLGWGAVDPEEDAKEQASKDDEAQKLFSAIDKAKSKSTLAKLKPAIGSLRGHKQFDSLKQAFTEKEQSL